VIGGAAIAGIGAWTAPIIIESLTSPAAAASCPSPFFVPGGAGTLAHTGATLPTTLTPALPFTPQLNDLILLVATYRGAELATPPDVSSPGYTLIASAVNPVSPNLRLRVLYKVAPPARPAHSSPSRAPAGAAAALFIYRCINPAAPSSDRRSGARQRHDLHGADPRLVPANVLVINAIAGVLSGGAPFTSAPPCSARPVGRGTTDGPQAIGVADILTTTVGAQAGSTWSTSPTSNNWVGLSFAIQL
jgi:hypothetical protein